MKFALTITIGPLFLSEFKTIKQILVVQKTDEIEPEPAVTKADFQKFLNQFKL